jgi:hypothetical protein
VSNKKTLALPGDISPGSKKWLYRIFITIVAIIGISLIATQIRGCSEQTQQQQVATEKPVETVQAISPVSSGTLTLSLGSRSALILPIEGQHIAFSSFGEYGAYNVYQDGTECAYGEQCISGKLLKGYYVTNKDVKEITVTFVFKKG